MKAVSPHGSGPRGRLKARAVGVAVVTAIMLMLALAIGGCGGDAQNGTEASQLDDEAAGASAGGEELPPEDADFGGSEGEVMAGYTWDQCVVDMTGRYGSEETARQVCSSVQADYGTSPGSELLSVLPAVEEQLGVTPANPSIPGGTAGGGGGDGGGDGGGSTGGNGDTGGSSGWGGIEIIVPPAP